MATRRPGEGQATDADQALRDLADREAVQRANVGRSMVRALNGSRAARTALGERMAAVTRRNWAGDRKNGERRG